MTHEELQEAVSLYAIDALDDQEREALESHLLTGCPTCQASLQEYRTIASLLPYGLPPEAAPKALKQQIMAVTLSTTPLTKARPSTRRPDDGVWAWIDRFLSPIRPFQPVLTLSIVIIIVGTAFCSMLYAYWAHLQMVDEAEQRRQAEVVLQEALSRTAALQQQATQQLQAMATVREEAGQRAGNAGETSRTVSQREAELNQLHAQMARMEKETAELRLELMQRDEMLAFLKSAHVTVVAGSGSAKQAGALLLYDRQTNKAFLYAYNMPPLPPGKTYQLWAIGEKPISAGVFRTDDGHKGRFITRNLPNLPSITEFAVSLEPEDGRSQPTGDLYLAGKI